MKKGKIIFKNLDLDGKNQDKWFKIFDLLDEIYTDEEKENISFMWDSCKIHNFNIQGKDLPLHSTKWEFGNFLLNEVKKYSSIEYDPKKGKVYFTKYYKSKN